MDRYAYGIFYQIPPGTEPTESDKEYLNSRVTVAKCYLDRYSGVSNDVRGFIMEGVEKCGKPTYAKNDIEKCLKEQGGGFDPLFTQVIDQSASTRCGEAVHGGRRSAVFKNLMCRAETTPHELLHSGKGDRDVTQRMGTGCGHSHSIDGLGRFHNMGDNTSIMGSNDNLVGMVAPFIYHMGWNTPEDTIIVKDQVTPLLIAPLEMDGLHPNEHKYVVLKVPGYNDMFLSLRLNYPYLARVSDPERLYVHELVLDHDEGAPDYAVMQQSSLAYPHMLPGGISLLKNGVIVKYNSFKDGIASVVVTPPGAIGEPTPLEQHDELPTFGEAPAAGTYYNPVSNGHGVDVQVKGDIYTISWFTGNEANDFPRWYTAAGRAGDTLPLFTTNGGTPWDPTLAEEEEVGAVRFTGNVLSFYMYDKDKSGKVTNRRRGGVKMDLLVANNGGGIFYDPARRGEGINVVLYDDFGTGEPSASVIFWTYGKRKLGVPHTSQRFYTLQGKLTAGGAYVMNAVAAWGEFMRFGAHIDEAGDGMLRVVDRDNVTFTLRVDGRNESYDMVRLV